MVNLFAFRATDPARLPADESAIGPENDRYLTAIAQEPTGDIIVAWGTKGSFLGRDAAVLSLLAPRPLWCLGVTAEGFPRHPLYVRGDIPFTPYERAGQARTAVCG